MLLTTHLVIQKEVKLYHQGKLLHHKWNGQSEAWDVGNVSWQGGLTMCPLGSDWICSRNSIYWEADLGPNTRLPFMGSMQVSKTAQRCTCVCVSHSVVSNSLQPHRLWHARLPCSSPTPGTCSCPLSWNFSQCFIVYSVKILPFFHWTYFWLRKQSYIKIP